MFQVESGVDENHRMSKMLCPSRLQECVCVISVVCVYAVTHILPVSQNFFENTQSCPYVEFSHRIVEGDGDIQEVTIKLYPGST